MTQVLFLATIYQFLKLSILWCNGFYSALQLFGANAAMPNKQSSQSIPSTVRQFSGLCESSYSLLPSPILSAGIYSSILRASLIVCDLFLVDLFLLWLLSSLTWRLKSQSAYVYGSLQLIINYAALIAFIVNITVPLWLLS